MHAQRRNTGDILHYEIGAGPVNALSLNPGTGALAAAVPEPQTWATLLAGIGLLGPMLWRRRAATMLTDSRIRLRPKARC